MQNEVLVVDFLDPGRESELINGRIYAPKISRTECLRCRSPLSRQQLGQLQPPHQRLSPRGSSSTRDPRYAFRRKGLTPARWNRCDPSANDTRLF